MSESIITPALRYPPNSTRSRLIFAGGIPFLVLMLAAMAGYAAWLAGGPERATRECLKNLTMINGAKEQFALDHKIKPGEIVTWEDLAPADGTGYLRTILKCPLGQLYEINPIGMDPTCSSSAPPHRLMLGSCCVVTTVE